MRARVESPTAPACLAPPPGQASRLVRRLLLRGAARWRYFEICRSPLRRGRQDMRLKMARSLFALSARHAA